MFCATVLAAVSISGDVATWGVIRQFGADQIGSSRAGGSSARTSSVAAAR